MLAMILTSLHDHSYIAAMLGFSETDSINCSQGKDSHGMHFDIFMAESLMKTLLQNLQFNTVSHK